jgi:deferrochelatase/peroxidase EfeB
MVAKLIENERTAMAQTVTRQPDGPGKRIGRRGELSGIGKLTPDGARIFRERLPQVQAEAAYWEQRVGTVHEFRIMLIDNDTRILFTIVFDGDFKPYLEDLLREATPWLDQIFLDVWEGYKGMKDPGPYCGAYIFMRVDDTRHARALLARVLPKITTSADWQKPVDHAWINIVFTHSGLTRFGVPREILDGFPLEFRVPMASRKEYLGDTGESDPTHWDHPWGSPELHVALMVMAADRASLEGKLAIGREALLGLSGVEVIGQLDIALPGNFREHFGFIDGISRPFIEGQGGTPLPGQGEPFRAGEFVLGYADELGELAKGPGPEAFWKNGTYLSVRKLHQKVAQFRSFLRDRARTAADEELLVAKMVGRWRSGCPLALSPDRDDPDIAKDSLRNNEFAYHDDDLKGLKTPAGSHIRRVNPRDALRDSIVNPRLHRIFRRGAAYGPMLPLGVLEDDGVARGSVIAFVNANPARQFEFVQSQWINDGDFISAGTDKDPLVGNSAGDSQYAFPAKPVRRRIVGLPAFVVTKGGEHVFLPGIRGLRCLAEGVW